MTKLNIKNIILLCLSILEANSIYHYFKLISIFLIIPIAIILYIILFKSYDKFISYSTKQKIVVVILALFFAMGTFFASEITAYQDIFSDTWQQRYILDYSLVDIMCYPFFTIFMMSIITGIDILYDLWNITDESKPFKVKSVFICALIMFICWLPYFLAHYPGTIYGDSIFSLKQSLGQIVTNHQPVLYDLILRFFINLGWLLHLDVNGGIVLYTLFQMITMALVLGYMIYWLSNKKIKKAYLYIILAFCSLMPIFPVHIIAMYKDAWFSATTIIIIIQLYEIIKSNGKWIDKPFNLIVFIVNALFMCFIRNNGFFVILPTCLILIFKYGVSIKKKVFKPFTIGLIALIIAYQGITGPLYDALNINKPLLESIAIPLQQMNSVIVYNMDGLNEEESEFLFEFMHGQKYDYREYYTPSCADTVKWSPNINIPYLEENKATFFKTWASLLPRNFALYVKAYVLETYEFWTINDFERTFKDGILSPQYDMPDYGVHNIDLIKQYTGIDGTSIFQNRFHFLQEGLVIWIMFIVSIIPILKKKSKYFIVFVPLILQWGTIMLSTPNAGWQRYILPAMFGLPLMLLLPALIKKEQ